MKQKAILVGCYALLNLVGGTIGYVVAHSLISLIASSFFALCLLICSLFIGKKQMVAYHIATFLTACLFTFFTYRFLLTYKFIPGGMMALISGILLTYLIRAKK